MLCQACGTHAVAHQCGPGSAARPYGVRSPPERAHCRTRLTPERPHRERQGHDLPETIALNGGITAFRTTSSLLSVTVPLTPTQRCDHAGRRHWTAPLLIFKTRCSSSSSRPAARLHLDPSRPLPQCVNTRSLNRPTPSSGQEDHQLNSGGPRRISSGPVSQLRFACAARHRCSDVRSSTCRTPGPY